MAFITKSTDTKCYSCGKQCINVEFCSAGASYNNDDVGSQGISISRNIRVSIIANPEFWGFSGVLISGWATYSNGYYDFFDGHDENHSASKTCQDVTYGPFLNEQRPDVLYRSVYDPDTGLSTHYGANGSIEGSGIGRGGAEVNLVNRIAGLVSSVTSDSQSCANEDPTQIFKQFPENFGFGNKINFNTKIYKNLSGAWRLTSLENCNNSANIYKPAGYLVDCSGNEKQNIANKYNQYQNYEPSRPRASGDSSYWNYVSGCNPDGSVAEKYAGYFDNTDSIYRSVASSEFVQAKLSYGKYGSPIAASGLKNGMTIGIKNEVSSSLNNVYTIFDVTHYATYTSVKFVGSSNENASLPTGDFSVAIGTSGHWVAFNTYDPQTCCGLNAYGVSDIDKSVVGQNNYHTDFRKVFNNPKNLIQSNRDRQWRNNYDLYETIYQISGTPSGRLDYTYPSVSGDYAVLIDINGNSIAGSGSGYPLFEKTLPYYGNFFDTDKYDGLKRFDESINRGKGRNATCYSKHATLEVFPDCVTQYDSYRKCVTETETYVTNRLPRLAFVYRGCDFNENCSFNESGLPLGGWKNQGNVPTGIQDLKRQLAGQEIHMFLNLGSAWGGRKPLNPCRCDCAGINEGFEAPQHVQIPSPLTFPSFPNFDIDPTGYGCKDARYQVGYKLKELNGVLPNSDNYCDPLHTSNYACLPKQPYVTYGYIMNLCGKQSNDRKSVISEAFAKLHQEKTYTNANPTGNIIEPMYWNVITPTPSPFSGNGVWSSGTSSRGDAGGFTQIAGSGYGFWGLADSNKQVVAPYFCTQQNSFICCENSGSFLDYSTTGTLSNILNTSNGWPTSKVPFLIELEVDDSCVGCVSASMKNVSLNLEIQGLDSEFIWSEASRFGHNYCAYGSSSTGGKAKIDGPPSFSCASGFNVNLCGTGDSLKATYGSYYTGNTCSCVNSFSSTLYPVSASGSNASIIGWTSNPEGNAAGLIEVTGCNDFGSSYLDATYLPEKPGGYRIFAQFDLACNGMHNYLTPASYPTAKYEGSPIGTLWGNSNGCSHHYPARVGSNGDLDLQTTLYLIKEAHVLTFRQMSSRGLKTKDLGQCITIDDFGVNGAFGVCVGDSVYTYGCKLGSFFYGCTNSGGYGPGQYLECTGNTLCNSCPTGVGSGEVSCSCGVAVGYEGIIPRNVPSKYYFNECYCQCSSPSLIAKYTATSTGLVLQSGTSAACALVYWIGTDSVAPIQAACLPPNPYIGVKLGVSSSTDWYDWSHGSNGIVSGVKYELNTPLLSTNTNCSQLSRGSSTAITCENTSCTTDNNVNSKTCGNPIYSSGSLAGINIRKKKCHPEVAIVTKIDCIQGTGYRLYLSREYHEHDRTWKEKVTIDGSPTCLPVNAGGYLYNDGTSSGCQQINYGSLSDTVTPVYNAPCSTHPSSGSYVTQDYKYQNSQFPSGSFVWNYFNLFYSSSFLPVVKNGSLIPSMARNGAGTFTCTGTPLSIVNTGTVFATGQYSTYNGIFATNLKHSCVQDSAVCGGELWCNKLFFPRHSYKAGTRIAPFGSPSICTANNEFKSGFGLDGYEENSATIAGGKDLLSEQKLRFFDWCDDSVVQISANNIGIDDSTIVVNDYLPLIGVIHPGWRFTADVKSCTIGGSGCQNVLPVHTENTILAGIHQPKTFSSNGFDSMGYYLDSSGLFRASGTSQCLFNPFKILIDVECSLNRIARKDFLSDSPTYLQGVQKWSSKACKGINGYPTCGCGSSKCAHAAGAKGGSCVTFLQAEYVASPVNGSYRLCQPGQYGCVGCSLTGCPSTNGNYLVGETPVATQKFFHPSVLTSTSFNGKIATSPIICTCASGSGTTSGVYTYATPMPSNENWMLNTCDGLAYRISSTTSTVRLWQCNSNQYIKNPFPVKTSCECQTEVTNNGLCTAYASCTDFSSCACNPLPNISNLVPVQPVGSASGVWWQSDCECEGEPQQEIACSTDSLVHWYITE